MPTLRFVYNNFFFVIFVQMHLYTHTKKRPMRLGRDLSSPLHWSFEKRENKKLILKKKYQVSENKENGVPFLVLKKTKGHTRFSRFRKLFRRSECVVPIRWANVFFFIWSMKNQNALHLKSSIKLKCEGILYFSSSSSSSSSSFIKSCFFFVENRDTHVILFLLSSPFSFLCFYYSRHRRHLQKS